MSSTSLEILVKARDEASSTLTKVKDAEAGVAAEAKHASGGLGSMSRASEGAGTKLKSLFKVAAGAIGAVGVEQFAQRSLEAFDDLEKGEKRLDLGLSAFGKNGAKQLQGVVAWSKRFSMATSINQSDIVNMTSRLATMGQQYFRSLGPAGGAKALEMLTTGMTNLGAATGKSASMLMRSLGPAIINSPKTAISLLQKYGVLTKTQIGDLQALGASSKSQLQALVKSGAVTKDYARQISGLSDKQKQQMSTSIEMRELQKRYAGEAAKTATPLEKLRNLFNQLELTAGKYINMALGWLLNHGPAIVDIIKRFGVVLVPVIAGWAAYQVAINVAAAAQAVFNAVTEANPLGLLALAVLLVAGLVIKNWSTIKRVTEQVWGAVTKFLKHAWADIKGVAMTVWHAILKVLSFTPLAAMWKLEWKTLMLVAKAGWLAIRDLILPLVKVFVAAWKIEFDVIKTVWTTVWNTLKTVFSDAWGVILAVGKPALNTLIDLLNAAIHGINAVIHGYNLVPGHADAPTIPTIPHLASGGIVTRPTIALIGEAGPEAVVPLGRGLGGKSRLAVILDRRRFVDAGDFDVAYRGY